MPLSKRWTLTRYLIEERRRFPQASRLFADRERVLDQSDLTTLEPADIRASRVFAPS